MSVWIIGVDGESALRGDDVNIFPLFAFIYLHFHIFVLTFTLILSTLLSNQIIRLKMSKVDDNESKGETIGFGIGNGLGFGIRFAFFAFLREGLEGRVKGQ